MRPLALVLLLTGCATFESTAREKFVHDATCPADRVTVKTAPRDAAPADVASDPGRLAIWNKDADERASHRLHVSGCGHEARYDCENRAEGTASWIECNAPPLDGIRRAVENLLSPEKP